VFEERNEKGQLVGGPHREYEREQLAGQELADFLDRTFGKDVERGTPERRHLLRLWKWRELRRGKRGPKPIRRVRDVSEAEGARSEQMIPGDGRFLTTHRNPVEPEPVGTYVALVFRVDAYRPDCDGSLMARLEAVNERGEGSGWFPDALGLLPGDTVALASPDVLFRLADEAEEGW